MKSLSRLSRGRLTCNSIRLIPPTPNARDANFSHSTLTASHSRSTRLHSDEATSSSLTDRSRSNLLDMSLLDPTPSHDRQQLDTRGEYRRSICPKPSDRTRRRSSSLEARRPTRTPVPRPSPLKYLHPTRSSAWSSTRLVSREDGLSSISPNLD